MVMCAALVFAGPALAQDDAPVGDDVEAPIAELRERLARIGEQVGADAADPALAHARRAMRAARDARRQGDVAGAERALAIADAALILADRLAAQRRARLALDEARSREREANARAEAARDALAQALVERARVLTLRNSTESAPAEGAPE